MTYPAKRAGHDDSPGQYSLSHVETDTIIPQWLEGLGPGPIGQRRMLVELADDLSASGFRQIVGRNLKEATDASCADIFPSA